MVEAQDIQEESTIIDIVFPSDFKIRINSIVDGEDTPIPFYEYPYLIFLITDNYGGAYKAIYSPVESERINVEVDTDNEIVYVIGENYLLKGNLKIKIGVAVDDIAFKDNKWNWFGAAKDLNARIIV